MSNPPLEIDARLWGWVKRRRVFWLYGPRDLSKDHTIQNIKLPTGFTITPKGQGVRGTQQQQRCHGNLMWQVQRADVKPWPSTILFEGGFTPRFEPGKGQATFNILTREFYHPEDRLASASPQAVDRFRADA